MQGWDSSSDSSIPSVLARECQKVVSCRGPEMVTLSVPPFHLPHLIYLLYQGTETQNSPHIVSILPTVEGFLSHLVALGSAEVQ